MGTPPSDCPPGQSASLTGKPTVKPPASQGTPARIAGRWTHIESIYGIFDTLLCETGGAPRPATCFRCICRVAT